MKHLVSLIIIIGLYGAFAHAQEMEIDVPDGWTAIESGIVKGNSELSVGPVLDLGELSPSDYLGKLAKIPIEGTEITSIGDLKKGNIVVQVLREVVSDGNKARSILFICKKGKNKNRLLELFTDDVFAVLSGGKAAISFCDQP